MNTTDQTFRGTALGLGVTAAAALRMQLPVKGICISVQFGNVIGALEFKEVEPRIQTLEDRRRELIFLLTGLVAAEVFEGVNANRQQLFQFSNQAVELMQQCGDTRDGLTIFTECRAAAVAIVRSEEPHIRRIADVLMSEGQLNAMALQQIVGGA